MINWLKNRGYVNNEGYLIYLLPHVTRATAQIKLQKQSNALMDSNFILQ